MRFRALFLVVACGGALPLLAVNPAATVDLAGNELRFAPRLDCSSVSVTVVGPSYELRKVFEGCQADRVELGVMQNGDYRFEVRLATEAPKDIAGSDVGSASQAVYGSFAVRAGGVVQPARGERAALSGSEGPGPGPNDFVVNDDLIVEGRGCFSSDLTCADLESFGSEDVKLKGGIPRLLFEDTNTDPNANDDWIIETGSASVEELHVIHVDSGNQPFTIAGGAASNSIFVDAQGDVGFGTNTPNSLAQVDVFGDLHLTNATNGWRMFNNSSYFGIRNTLAGDGQLNVAVDAPMHAINATATGVGIGTLAPASTFHVQGAGGTTQLRVEELSATAVGRNLARFANNGASTFRFDNTQTGSGWGFGSRQIGDFFVSTIGAPAVQMNLTSAGNMTITGAYASSSDRNAKDDINSVDPAEVLAKVAELPIASWRFKGDASTHVGPMAQDFYAAFGLGPDDKHIVATDMAGLALAAIQALRGEVTQKDAQLQQQAAQIRALADRLAQLEQR